MESDCRQMKLFNWNITADQCCAFTVSPYIRVLGPELKARPVFGTYSFGIYSAS